MVGESAATGRPVSDSVHVLRVAALPDNQEAAVAFNRDGSVIIYMREDHITDAGATALQSAMDCARDVYHRAWRLPAVLAS
jgi:hypothetical protein